MKINNELFHISFNTKSSESGVSFYILGFPHGSVIKNPPANARDVGSIPGSERSHGGGNGNSFQYSCLKNPTDRGPWGCKRHNLVTKQQQQFQLLLKSI